MNDNNERNGRQTQDVSNDVQERQTLQREIELAVKTMQDSGDPRATKMAGVMRDVVERGDYSAFPPEARESLERIKALDAHTQRIIDTQLEPARHRASRANTIYLTSIGVGAIAAGGLAAYLTGGMSLLPQLAITGATAGGGFLAGHITSRNILKKDVTELEAARTKALDSDAQAQKERDVLHANSKTYAEQIVRGLEPSGESPLIHAGNVKKAPSISERAARENANTSHVAAVYTDDSPEEGRKR